MASFWSSQLLPAYTLQNLTTNVNLFCGTAGGGDAGDCVPGAVSPLGMVQWSPDTITQWPGGYLYSDTQIHGFGLTHASGAGCNYGGDVGFTPFLGSVSSSPYSTTNYSKLNGSFYSTFSHANEIAVPGYYAVLLNNGIRTELTTTTRTGFGRFTYPSGNTASMLINAGGDANGTVNASIQVNAGGNEVSGWTEMPGMCGLANSVLYFDIVFDHAFTTYGLWNGTTIYASGTTTTGANTGAYLTFNLPGGGAVLARTALSYVSVANAQNNLRIESPAPNFTTPGFNSFTNAASTNWNGYLNKVQVNGGTAADTVTFYTMLYHCLQGPEVVSDDNGQYLGFDGNVHTVSGRTQYGWFSGWDIYRSECQLVALLDPASASDMAQSLVQDALDGGAMPRWPDAVGDTGLQIGDCATPMIADMYAFGATNFNTASALVEMVKAAVNPITQAKNGIIERDANRDYLNLGFVPEYQIGSYAPVSMTLEYCSDDFALARFAQALGDTTNYTLAMNRAQNWRNHFNTSSGYFQMRRSDGLWSPGFTSDSSTYDNYNLFAEGTGAQYIWMVPFNLGSLIDLMGGAPAASARLDTFFTQLNDDNTSVTQYAYLGDEPCLETPWIYNFTGEPYKTSAVVRRALTQLYSTAPGGLPGNDDIGELSSWYVFAALGLYPEIPGDDALVLHGPLFPQAIIHLANGDLTITGSGAADNAPYIQSLTVNGQLSNTSWIRFGNFVNGGTLAFTMGTSPNTNWGSNALLAPPSYMDGMTTPLAQNYVWGTGLESGEAPLTATNIVDTVSPSPGISNVGPFNGASVPELGVRNEISQSGSAEIMYSGNALGGTTDYAYMKAFDLTGQNLTVSPGLHLSYWVYPQSSAGPNSAYVAMDVIFTDGTTLQTSGLKDQHGTLLQSTAQGSQLILDSWNYVTVDLTPLAGKIVNRVDWGYNRPNSSGTYRGYMDDLAFTTPATLLSTNNLALNQPASTDSQLTGEPASAGNDGNILTGWSAADQNLNHWWQVDLGAVGNLTGDEVIWPTNGVVYDYTVAVSLDNIKWTTVVNQAANTSTAQDQADVFIAAGRYVRITLVGLPAGLSAGFNEFRMFGNLVALPSIPTNVIAHPGYGLVGLNWQTSVGATSYNIERSTSSGTETMVATALTTNYTDFGLTNGTTYYYVISAQNLAGQSAGSSEAMATPRPLVAGSYEAAVVTNHPVAYWPLTEANGTIAYDLVGGWNGTYVGGVTLGRTGVSLAGFVSSDYAALFDGSSGYVDIPEGPFNLTNALTMVVWVNIPNTPAHFSGIFGHGDSSWRFSLNTAGDPGAANGGSGDATSSASIIGSGWHMLAYSYTGVPNAANNGSLYVDGTLAAHDTVPVLAGNGNDVWIGGAPDYGTGRLLAGSIAHAAIFTNGFSASQIQALYHASLTAPPVTLKLMSAGAESPTLTWNYGVLLQATNIFGPWTTNLTVSPYTLGLTNPQMFFQVKAN